MVLARHAASSNERLSRLSGSPTEAEVGMGRPSTLFVKAGEIPDHGASSASAPLYLALTPTANPPVESLPAPFALVGWPTLDEMWAWTT